VVLDPRKRQKKLERKKAKDKARKTELAKRAPEARLPDRLMRAAEAPILHATVQTVLWDEGMGQVLVSRELDSGNVAFAVFLVDAYCLGVKDALYGIGSRAHYDFKLVSKITKHPVQHITPPCARNLVEGAVAYAMDLGFPPHSDYHVAQLIFGDIDASACSRRFEYGKDGKPLFVAGPYDSPARCAQIARTLANRCGADGYHFILPGGLGLLNP
jgi:hypothetical protein